MANNRVFWGKVVPGKKRGKSLGFPTANIKLRKKIPHGIYISQSKTNNKLYPSITFIGPAITFGETNVSAETYIVNFKKTFYGKWISIRLLQKIRENKKFKSKKDLITQMRKDLQVTKNYFKSKNV